MSLVATIDGGGIADVNLPGVVVFTLALAHRARDILLLWATPPERQNITAAYLVLLE